MGWVILIGAVVIIAGIVVALTINHSKKEEAARQALRARRAEREREEEQCFERLGGLVFEHAGEGMTSRRKPLTNPRQGDFCVCITPYGVMEGRVDTAGSTAAVVKAKDGPYDYVISIKQVPNYFSEAMADKLGVQKVAWIVGDIKQPEWPKTYVEGMGRTYTANIRQHVGAKWLRSNTVFGDFLDIMIEELWFELMFGGFMEPVEYYEQLEPIREDGEATGEVTNWTSEEERRFAEDEATVEAAMDSIEESQAANPAYDPTTTTAMFPDSSPGVEAEPDDVETKRSPPTWAPPEPSYEPESSSGGGGWSSDDGGGGGGGDSSFD